MKRILLVQPGDIGDLIVTTPAIDSIRAAHPDVHLTLLTTAHAAAVVPEDMVDEIVTFDRAGFNSSIAFFKPANLRRIMSIGHHDAVIFFRHFTLKAGTLKFALIAAAARTKRRIGLQNGNGWFLTDTITDEGFGAKHEAQYWLDLAQLVNGDSEKRRTRVKIAPPPADFDLDSRLVVVIHPGSGGYSMARRWDAEKFAQVADQLHDEMHVQIVLVGGAGDDTISVLAAMQHQPIDLTGKTSLSELAGVIQQADLFIGADSGVMHVASATDTPIIAIFGPSNHRAWRPWMPAQGSVVLRSAPECSPCSYVDHGIGLRDGCPARTCMRMVTAKQVINTAMQILRVASDIEQSPSEAVTGNTRHTKRIQVLGLPVDVITYEVWLDLIGRWIEDESRPYHVCTTNPEFMMIAQKDVNFRNILRRADLCVPDGVGLLWAAKHIGEPLPERVTGSDGVPRIAERASIEGWRLFLLGAAPGIAEKTANILCERHPGLQIAGTYAGSPAPDEEDFIVSLVNQSNADILLVAYGAPQQDKWIARNLPRLQVSMAMGVGGAFDFIAGIIPRAPLWMQRAGLEWLYRLYLQPWRIQRMSRLPRFVLAVLLRGDK